MQFRKIEEVENESPNTVIDVVGIVESVQSSVTIQKKDGTETQKRGMLLRDQTGRSVELSMWGNLAENPGISLEEARLWRPLAAAQDASGGRASFSGHVQAGPERGTSSYFFSQPG